MKKKTFVWGIILLSCIGALLRYFGLDYVGVDMEYCLLSWYEELENAGGLRGLANFSGDYNMPYITLFYLFTKLPFRPIVNIKLSSMIFDYLLAFVVMCMVRECVKEEKKNVYGVIAYALVLCSPIVIINSAYLGQCESVWAAGGVLGFWLLYKGHPVLGMLALGFAIAMKPQGIFILPIILLFYVGSKSFSILHFSWVPVAIQILCIPAIIGGCDFFVFYKIYVRMMGSYPHVYYYYPNIWTFIKNAPYYIFGKVGILSAFAVLLIIALLFVGKRRYELKEYILYLAWTTMTCAMILPCMHERYNYLGEVMLPIAALFHSRLRMPALFVVVSALLCYGQSYLGWGQFSHFCLAMVNIVVYFALSLEGYRSLRGEGIEKGEAVC